jgi:hypothetical protein
VRARWLVAQSDLAIYMKKHVEGNLAWIQKCTSNGNQNLPPILSEGGDATDSNLQVFLVSARCRCRIAVALPTPPCARLPRSPPHCRSAGRSRYTWSRPCLSNLLQGVRRSEQPVRCISNTELTAITSGSSSFSSYPGCSMNGTTDAALQQRFF